MVANDCEVKQSGGMAGTVAAKAMPLLYSQRRAAVAHQDRAGTF